MRIKIIAFLTATALVFGIMPVALANTPFAEETPYDAADYIDVTKDASGKTTEFSIDFDRGIDKLENKDLKITYVWQSTIEDNNASAVYYIGTYGKDEGEWNGALDRSRLFATSDQFNYELDSKRDPYAMPCKIIADIEGKTQGVDYFTNKPGQIYHNQWSEPDSKGKVILQKNEWRSYGAYIIDGYSVYGAYTPNVVAGGKFFPEILAFSQRMHMQNGAKPITGTANVYGNLKNRNFAFSELGQIDSLTVIEDPTDPDNSVLKFTGYHRTGLTTGNEADFFVMGKENVDLADRATVFETKLYIDQDLTISNGTFIQKNKKPFTIQIAKNVDYYKDFLDRVKYDGIMYPYGNLDRLNTSNKGMAEYLDAMTLYNGKVYLGMVDEANIIGTYKEDKWYTIRYSLNTQGATPIHAIEMVDEDGKVVASGTKEVELGKHGTFGWLAGDTDADIAKRKSYYSEFKGFDKDSKYDVFVRVDSAEHSQSEFDFICYVDDMRLKGNNVNVVTDANKYFEAPIAFVGEQVAEIEFDAEFINELNSDFITVLDVNGEEVPCDISTEDNKKITFTFPNGLLPATNYYVNLNSDLMSASGNIAANDKLFTIRTCDVLDVDSCTLSGTDLTATITNNSDDSQNIVVVCAVKNDGLLVNNKIYYKAVAIDGGDTVPVSLTNVDAPYGSTAEVFVLDGLETLKSYCELRFAE